MIGTLSRGLHETVRRHGNRTAIIHEGGAVLYTELDGLVEGVAAALRRRGVGDGDCVVWHGRKSLAAISVVHGILRAGAGYVPLDPDGPMTRARVIVDRQQPRAVVADREAMTSWRRDAPDQEWLRLGAAGLDPDDLWITLPPGPSRSIPEAAYVLHTSGSTGVPKGVVHTHASADAFVSWAAGALELSAADVILSSAPLHFDLSTFDVFGASRTGATLALLPPADAPFPASYMGFCQAADATVWYTVPSTVEWLGRRGPGLLRALSGLRVAAFAGEVLRPATLLAFRAAAPRTRVWNLYGPTETNVCTAYEVDGGTPVPPTVPIGRPLPGTDVAVVDHALRPVPDGVAGELLVRGPTTMRGYLGEEDPAHSFVHTPDGRRWYATGDQVVRNAQGELEFAGRLDDQVKRRGYRIELGEIEATARRIAGVEDCVAVATPGPGQEGPWITAFVQHGAGDPPDRITAALKELLPFYMVPDQVMSIQDEMPKLSNGKTDRKRLAEIARDPAGAGQGETPDE